MGAAKVNGGSAQRRAGAWTVPPAILAALLRQTTDWKHIDGTTETHVDAMEGSQDAVDGYVT